MQPFKKNGRIIDKKVLHQLFRRTGRYYIWKRGEQVRQARFPFIIKYVGAVLFKFFFLALSVFKAMERDGEPFVVQGLELVKHINHPAVIGWERHVERNYVKALIQEIISLFLIKCSSEQRKNNRK